MHAHTLTTSTITQPTSMSSSSPHRPQPLLAREDPNLHLLASVLPSDSEVHPEPWPP